MDFTHLHVHTHYSILDGMGTIPKLVDKAMTLGMKGIAITDHGNMFGIPDFLDYVQKKNQTRPKGDWFKPIVGCELYVAQDRLTTRMGYRDFGTHLTVLAKNKYGYSNLVKLLSNAWTEGFYRHPRTDKYELAKHKEGLIVLSGCLGGEIPRLILWGKTEEAEQRLLWFKETFGEDFYIEITRHQTEDSNANTEVFKWQEDVNPILVMLAKKHGIKIVATNDVHFVNRDDADVHECLPCVALAKKLDVFHMHYTKEEWLKSAEEMCEIFQDIPDSISNTQEIFDKVQFYSIESAPATPTFTPDNGKSDYEYLQRVTNAGVKEKYGEDNQGVNNRVLRELDVIRENGLSGLFLIIHDIINHAISDPNINIGAIHGALSQSLVAYSLGITRTPPLEDEAKAFRFLTHRHNILNPITIDIDRKGRDAIWQYIQAKYGNDKVARIASFQRIGYKTSIMDIARVHGLAYSEAIAIVKSQVNQRQRNGQLKIILNHAKQIEGNIRGISMTPDGVVMSPIPISSIVPVMSCRSNVSPIMLMTQYSSLGVETSGLLRINFRVRDSK